jgi:hypothetical protein
MNVTGFIVFVVLVLAAVAAAGVVLAAKRRHRSEQLQERFGPEYEREVEQQGDRKAAETRLADVIERRGQFEVRPLGPQEREGFRQRWLAVQGAFVDDPRAAVRDADRLVAEVMQERGYPVDDFNTKIDMVAADHPALAGHYRAAHAVGEAPEAHGTEAHRRAFVHYRALFAELLGQDPRGRHAATVTSEATPRPE